MPAPKLDTFLSDPKHKEEADFLRGVIDARVKELAAQYKKEKPPKKIKEDDDDDENKEENGSFWDSLFGASK